MDFLVAQGTDGPRVELLMCVFWGWAGRMGPHPGPKPSSVFLPLVLAK